MKINLFKRCGETTSFEVIFHIITLFRQDSHTQMIHEIRVYDTSKKGATRKENKIVRKNIFSIIMKLRYFKISQSH